MSIISRWMPRLGRRSPSPPRVFPNTGFTRIPSDMVVDEETFPDYQESRYYPVRIGEVFASRYQVVGKLGYGISSTVWLARDLNQHSHVVLKVFIRSHSFMEEHRDKELNSYKRISSVSATSWHPGRKCMRTLLDCFNITGPHGDHQCMVHPPLWDSLTTFLMRNPDDGRLPGPLLGAVLFQLLRALDFMHTECKLIHTDLRPDNIMFGCKDSSIFDEFEQRELENPCSTRETEDGRVIYASRQLNVPHHQMLTPPVLCDFGAVVSGEQQNTGNAQPPILRAPEVILGLPWSYEIDIWNTTRTHLADMIALLGPPPPEMIASGRHSSKYFSADGNFKYDIPPAHTLDSIETTLQRLNLTEEREMFLKFVGKMMHWDPKKRATARELIDDPWLKAVNT
ncbi:Serine/threonine-protein kinase [Diplogelasinospora grovesii]|uniref:EKC/KEOPS complex subunit BUD32 n=1 Tax=Diplogelasinospora grovesii TaxID=303347 RepID=A0AAN6MV15_9PEZI|nr:Serine/threonine-protein kinase [Diplogelasinospora grovesii]